MRLEDILRTLGFGGNDTQNTAPAITNQSSATNPYAANYLGRQETSPGVAPAGTVPQSSDTNPFAANYQGVQSGGGGSVLGANDTILDGVNKVTDPANQGEGGNFEADLAGQVRQNEIEGFKTQAGNLRNQAQGNFDDILKAIGSFRDRAKTQFSNAGQEITDTASGILGSNARTAREASGEARSRGRALGLGDSSKFNLQNKVQGNLASTQGNVIARRGQENRSNRGVLDERNDQADFQETQANTALSGANDRATQIENTGINNANFDYKGSLNDIVNYQRQLAAINPLQAGGLNQNTSDFSGILNSVNNTLSGLDGGGGGNTANQQANPVNPLDIFSRLQKQGLVPRA